jgi:hypothetical protein
MLIKTTFTLAMALTLALASAALAARSGGNGRDGSRELANGQAASSGVNPAEHRALAAPKAVNDRERRRVLREHEQRQLPMD